MTDVVYYLRRGDLIKIGWSGNLKARMRTLRPDELLAVEPGCMHIETGRHHQFATHRLPNTGDGDEWFSPAPELLGHIELIARMYPTPDLADLLPRPSRGGVALVHVIPAVRAGDLATVRRVAALRDRDLQQDPDAALIAGYHDAVRSADLAVDYCRQILGVLRERHSWSELVSMTGEPQSTLYNRANPRRAKAPEPDTGAP